jgi:sugar phosphate permease
LAGMWVDRLGVRKLMVLGLGVFALLYFAYGFIAHKYHLYAIHVGFGLVLVCAGVNIAVILSSQWFVKHRGTAVGMAVMGSSLGGIVLPPLIVQLIGAFGWRQTFGWMALAPIIFLLMTLALVRTPKEKGTVPLGFGEPTNAAAAPSVSDVRYRDALKTRSFWALAFVAMATFYSVLGLISNAVLHMKDLGFDQLTAISALAWLLTPGFFSKFLFGYLADRLNPRVVFSSNVLIMVIGLLLLATLKKDLIWAALVIIGFGWGGLYTLIQLQAVNNFGLTDAGKILGTITFLDAIMGGIGIWLTALLFDKFGNYQSAFYIMCVLVSAAFAASFFVKREIKAGPTK